MAKRVTEKKSDRKQTKKGSKGNIFTRIGRFFANLAKELKKVTWPDKLKLKRTAAVTFAIILTVIILITITDFVLRNLLNVAGFNQTHRATQPNQVVTESAASSVQSSTSLNAGTDTTASSASTEVPSISVETSASK